MAKSVSMEGYLSGVDVCSRVSISPRTLYTWYDWYESSYFVKPDDVFLPEYYKTGTQGSRFWKEEDMPKLEEFKRKLRTTHRGMMNEYNATYAWGPLGARMLRKQGKTREEIKTAMAVEKSKKKQEQYEKGE